MSDIKLTVNQVAQEIGESVNVLRNWVKELRPYIPFEKSENGYNLYTQESINVLKRIQKMHREQNLTVRQIEAILSGAEKPVVQDEEQRSIEAVEAVRELLEEQREFNRALLEQLAAQQKQFEQYVTKRDETIMHVLRELQEAREQRYQLKSGQKPWYQRWFKPKHDDIY